MIGPDPDADLAAVSAQRDQFGLPVGAPVAEWTARPLPPRTPLRGRYCRLDPVDVERDSRQLYEAYATAPDHRDWTYLPASGFDDHESYRQHLAAQAGAADPMHHTITDLALGRAVGTAALMRIDPDNGVIEVGHITYSPLIQRTRAGTEAMYLLMRRVFDELGYRRYEWKCDSLNAPSRTAALRYGFQFEGIFRKAVVYKGRNRDTAWFSIVDDEWPGIKDGLEAWLAPANFNSGGRQLRPLAVRPAEPRSTETPTAPGLQVAGRASVDLG